MYFLKTTIIIILFNLSSLLLKSQWLLIFEDNFEGNQLNKKYWYDRRYWGDFLPNVEPAIHLPENVSVENGHLYLRFKPENKWHIPLNYTDSFFYPYSAGMIWSKVFFRYGVIEARIKIPNTIGAWAAFWLYGHASYGDEIDIFEQYWPDNNNKVDLKTTIHHSGEKVVDNNKYHRSFIDNQWRVYTLSWDNVNMENARIKVHIDGECVSDFVKNDHGRLYNTIAGNVLGKTVKYPEYAENIILSLGGPHDNYSISSLLTMVVDYVKVWQKQNCDGITTLCNYNHKLDNNFFTGKIIQTGNNCHVTVDSSALLFLYATKEIHLKPGFSVKRGGNFVGRIIPCSQNKSLPVDMSTKDTISFNDPHIHFLKLKHCKIYPNPVNNKLFIEFSDLYEKSNDHIEIYDIYGKLLLNQDITNSHNEFDLSFFDTGINFIKVIINEEVYYEKVVKL